MSADLQLATPHGPDVAVINGRRLAYVARLQAVATAAHRVAVDRGLFVMSDELEPLTTAERSLRDALLNLGGQP